MKSIAYAVIAIILYAVQNTIIDVKLKQYSTVSLLLGFYAILLPLGALLFFHQKFTGKEVTMPAGSALGLLAAVAIMFFIADFFYVSAYTKGGNAVAVTTVTVLMPVIAAVIKFVWLKELPTPYHFGAFVCAAGAIILIAVGDSKKTPVPMTETSEAAVSE